MYDEEIHRIMRYLCRDGVEELTINDHGDSSYNIPGFFFFHSCRSLVRLELESCDVMVPKGFGGFPCLKYLVLERVYIDDEGVRLLVSKCGALEDLIILNCFSIRDLKICSSSLLWLKVVTTSLMGISVKNATSLRHVDVDFSYDLHDMDYDEFPSPAEAGADLMSMIQQDVPFGYDETDEYYLNLGKPKFFQFLRELSHVENLYLEFNDVFAEAFKETPARFPQDVLLTNLKMLDVEMDLVNPKSLSILSWLLHSCCPNLITFTIKAFGYTDMQKFEFIPVYWERQSPLRRVMHHMMYTLREKIPGLLALMDHVKFMGMIGKGVEEIAIDEKGLELLKFFEKEHVLLPLGPSNTRLSD